MEAASVPALRKLEPRSSPPLGLFLAGNLWDSCAEESRPQGHALPGSTQESTLLQALSPRASHTQVEEDFGTSMRMLSWRHLPHRCGLRPQQQVDVFYEHRQRPLVGRTTTWSGARPGCLGPGTASDLDSGLVGSSLRPRLARPDIPTGSSHQAAGKALGLRGRLPTVSGSPQAWQKARKSSVLQE
ncbi:unnamed protein product [Rangifer tarandus platyrhynchus]|uniref:Uncharacterized protein n=2 Tax=Rangifer tarandus platyrhynchus TaxID=3082113 RepID=A0ABN8Y3B0_RANTA|nr:unnamed protein product [Rangifer tarandus platyrhynchus]CAI9693257.1 unnamed protein product [Rangifer tarandus platyrhynchus]